MAEKRVFVFDNTVSYKRYRINVTANNGDASFLAIGELEMMKAKYQKLNQLPSHSEQNLIKYGLNSPIQVGGTLGIFSNKNYFLQDTVSEDVNGLWTTQINRKPLSIKFDY